MPWRPTSQANRHALEEPYEDIPPHLRSMVLRWIELSLSGSYDTTIFAVLHFRMEAPDPRQQHGQVISALMQRARASDEFALDLIQALLENPESMLRTERVSELARLLTAGNSAYAVRPDGRGIEMRTLPETRESVSRAIDAAQQVGSISAHLANAWNAAFSINPDAREAYAEAVFAVEGSAIPVVVPNQAKPHLGHVIGELDKGAWQIVLAADEGSRVETVTAMLRTLWTGQTRHAGMDATTPETVEAAQAAVFLAATLVQWFVSGAVSKSG